jgi:hypothetical protein
MLNECVNLGEVIPKKQDEKPLLGRLWDFFLILMIGWFLFSIVDSEVNAKYKEKKRLEAKKTK